MCWCRAQPAEQTSEQLGQHLSAGCTRTCPQRCLFLSFCIWSLWVAGLDQIPRFLGDKAGCLSPKLCLARSSVLEQGLMPDFCQTASWPAMGAGLLREPCLGYQGRKEHAFTEAFSCDFKFSFLHRYKMQSFQSKLCQGYVS